VAENGNRKPAAGLEGKPGKAVGAGVAASQPNPRPVRKAGMRYSR